jgi:hypothetical protein
MLASSKAQPPHTANFSFRNRYRAVVCLRCYFAGCAVGGKIPFNRK